MKRHLGISLPLSAIWSTRSFGCGEFLDLLPLLSWLPKAGFNLLQLLPINDTGEESSPYSAISTCALNPLFLSLQALPGIRAVPTFPRLTVAPSRSLPCYLDLAAIRREKLKILEHYLATHGPSLLQTPAVTAFIAEHRPWLGPYAAFTWQKHRQQERPFWDWGLNLSEALAATPDTWFQRESLVQYLCWEQLLTVRRYADQQGVSVLGDLPILCNRDSVDVWANPDLFDLSLEAGAPPDAYNAEGQVWGFPIFKWTGHVCSGFSWWRQRLHLAAHAYQLLRIDHILGFFRIWAVPRGMSAREGFFLPKEMEVWLSQGEAILRMLQLSTSLQLVGEDLGSPLAGLQEVLQRLGIPGMSVQRWMRDWEGDRSFIPPEQYPSLSLACLSTHDSSLLGEWWQSEAEDAQRLCQQYGRDYEVPIRLDDRRWMLELVHSSPSCLIVNLLQEYLACFPDLLPAACADQRINLPGVVRPQNWTLSLAPSVEQIVTHSGLLKAMQELATRSTTGY